MKSIRDIYKIGKGPSSSHTMGPGFAAAIFKENHPDADSYKVILYGSLAKTGVGHGTDRVLVDTFSPKQVEVVICKEDPEDIKHPNTLDLIAIRDGEEVSKQRYISIGGGDIILDGHRAHVRKEEDVYLENSFAEIKQFCAFRYVDLAEYIELSEGKEIWDFLAEVWKAMENEVEEGR